MVVRVVVVARATALAADFPATLRIPPVIGVLVAVIAAIDSPNRWGHPFS